jgi:fumarate reductase (CoM/CoB) subunit A
VRFVEEVFITRLFSSDGSFSGAIGIDSKGGVLAFRAPCAVLATGGYAQVYRQTNNAAGMTGDGHVLAYDLGLSLRDMEFIQFYPTALSNGARILLYETFLARSGGVLRNALGEDILARRGMKDPMAVTRDQLSRTIMLEVMEGRGVDGGVLMDLTSISREELDKFRHLLPANRLQGQLRFQVSPTAHFCMGGIVADASARTAVKGLYAAGELCGGMHGANRLAGNALTEVFAMGSVAGTEAAREALNATHRDASELPMDEEKARLESLWGDGKTDVRELRRTAREVMWLKAGVIREKGGIQEAADRIRELRDRLNESGVQNPRELIRRIEFEHSLTVSEMICRAALMREESRGAHFRRDYPAEDDRNWMKNIFVRKRGTEMALEAVDVGSRQWIEGRRSKRSGDPATGGIEGRRENS